MAKFPANARVEDFRTEECRISYAQNLFQARDNINGVKVPNPKYGCTLIFPKSYLPVLRDKVLEVARRAWPTNGVDRLKSGLIKSPLLMGDGKEARDKETGALKAGMGADVFFIRPTANEDRPPQIRARGLGPHVQATQQDVYSGCYGFAVLNVWPWNHPQSGDGIGFGIAMFQKIRDGESLGGAAPIQAERWYIPDDETTGTEEYGDNPFA